MNTECNFDDSGHCGTCQNHMNDHVESNCAMCDNKDLKIESAKKVAIIEHKWYPEDASFPFPEKVIICGYCGQFIGMFTESIEEQVLQWDEHQASILIDREIFKVYCTCPKPLMYFQSYAGNLHKINISTIDNKDYSCEFENTYHVRCFGCSADGGVGFSKEEAVKKWNKRFPKPYTPEDAPDALQEILDLFENDEAEDKFGFSKD